jgi:hypothetical protein
LIEKMVSIQTQSPSITLRKAALQTKAAGLRQIALWVERMI